MAKEITEGIEITDLDELGLLIGKAYWIESQLELSVQWEAYMSVKEKYKDVLFKIAHDSAGHKSLLKRMCSSLEGFDLDEATKNMMDKEFDFRRLMDQEIMTELLKYDLLAFDIYKRLYSFSNRNFIKKIWKDKDSEIYFRNLEWLIKEEEKHIELLKSYAGKIERIH